MGPPLLSRGAFLACLLLLQTGDDVVVAQTEMDGNQIVGVAAAGNTIHAEQFLDLSSLPYPATINVVSDVPVTVERYYDSGYYMEGQQPLRTYMGKVLVTSNCDTSETTVIPNIAYDNGTITVTLDGVSEDEAKGMEFLEPSYYEALWTWVSGFCPYFISTSGTPPVTTTASETIVTSSTTGAAVSGSGVECQIGEAANPDLDCATEGEFCQLDTGVCNNKSGIHYGICVTIPQMCTEEYNPVCGCDEMDYSNSCAAHSNGISVSRMGLCSTSTSSTASAATESIASGSTTTAFIATASGTECQIGESADPTMGCTIEGEFCQLEMGVCSDGSGIQYGVCATIPEACTLDYNPVCGCDELDYSNACAAFSQGVSVSRMGQCTTTSSVATESSGGGTSTVMIATGTACQIGSSADPAMACTGVGEFCQLEIGVCNNKSGILDGVCATIPQVCTEEYNPVCGCDEMDYSNSCAAHSNGVSVSRMGLCTTSSTMSVATVAASPGAITTTVLEDIIVTTTAASSLTTNVATASSSSETSTTATSATASVATETSAATTVASSTGTTTTSTNGTTTEFVGIGEFPTEAPSSNSTTVGGVSNDPNNLEQQDDSRGTSPNSAINRSRSVSICIASAFLAIIVISVILPGNGTGSQQLWGIGIAVAAVAASSLYSRPTRSVRAMQQSSQGSKGFPSQVRNLQTCSFNVEVLLDSCTKTVAVAAPAGRFISVVLANQTSVPVDNCTYSYEANLTFPVANAITLDLTADDTVEAFDSSDFRCLRAVEGRPFVDASGGGLLAEPCAIGDGDDASAAFSWIDETSAKMHNVTTDAHTLLGEYWTQRALGEHASVASFSAFTISLMTNQAPSDLVEGALKAGLDEIRHAKTSFEIASILAGKSISPGPLPSSSHAFHHDLTSLAMAVAREGCVDETISAFVAAAEAVHISEVLEKGVRDSKYSNVDRDTLTFIRDELANIAMDESNHSALAWQTLQWVCSVDASACDTVFNDVFNESALENRFVHRAHNALGEVSSPGAIRSEWNKIFNAALSGAANVGGVDGQWIGQCFGNPLVTSMTDNVLRQISRSSAEAFVSI